MFQKPAFGATTSSFGSFNAGASTASPFSGFKSTAGTSAFGGSPAFGANATPQQNTSGGLFGTPGTSGGLFGNNTTPTSAPGFGATTSSGFGFGQANTSGGLFGSTNTSGSLFGGTQQQNTSAFGAKPSGFGFGATTPANPSTGGLFGGSTTSGGGLFGQQNTSIGGGGLFGNTSGGFGQQQASGTAHVKYNPVVGTDVIVKSGTSQNINIKHHCITCMKDYENKSLEELRLEDYVAGRKGSSSSGMFGGFQAQPETKPLFGGGSFGQPATTSAPSVFGGGGLNTSGGFGQTNAFSFGGAAQNTTTNSLFGGSKPAFGATSTPGSTLFGAATTQPAPAFGTPTSSFGFGSNTQNQSSTLFGGKAAAPAFGSAPAPGAAGFGGFGAGAAGGLFGPKPTTAAPAFGTAAPAFGSTLAGGFGTNTSTSSGIFGPNNSFGPKPAAPNFGFNQQPGGLGTTGGLGSSFQNKPQGSLFPTFSTTTSSIFNTGGQNTQPLSFNTGNTTLGGGLGGGLNFGPGSSGLGASSLGGLGSFGSNTNTTLNTSNLTGAASGSVHEQILTLAARPYGDSPLYKDLVPDSTTTAEDVLRPTNPAAVKAVLDAGGAYRVSAPAARLTVRPHAHDKKSLFDGLEESDASLEDKLSLKPSRKRLVLRPQQSLHDSPDGHENRSNESVHSPKEVVADTSANISEPFKQNNSGRLSGEVSRRRSSELGDSMRGVNTDLEESSEKHSSWLGSSKLPWNGSKEKSLDAETPRLYPQLDKEAPMLPERRASWLTTKPLRKPAAGQHEAETSVRELRTDPRRQDKENRDGLSVSEEEHVAPVDRHPHPTGVKLTRPGYYTIPTLDEMIGYMRPDGSCVVPHLTIGRKNYGNVYYDCDIDVAGLDIDQLVHFLNKEVIVYPDDLNKPDVGDGLNRRAIVTLDRVWPRDKTEKKPITDPERLLKMDYEGKLRRVCDKHDTKFIEYRPQTGSWVFRVEHFSKYGLTDSDEEDEPAPLVMQRQLVTQTLQKSAATMPPKVPMQPGLGGMSALVSDDSLFSMQQTSVNLLNGASKVFDMDTTEGNHDGEGTSLYPDTSRMFGVKSPTSELARLEHRSSHNVQLMKASLYADTEMADDVSVSTGDQRVPSPEAEPARAPAPSPGLLREEAPPAPSDEIPMKPLLLQPHTIVLNYHRKVPPFKQTIAGRLQASCAAELAVSRARHSRVGFAPGARLAYATSRDALAALPPVEELSELGKYVRGRGPDDWSEPVVARLSLYSMDGKEKCHDVIKGQLKALLEHSEFVECEGGCPHLKVKVGPRDRLGLLRAYLREAEGIADDTRATFGVSGAYCYEVFKLCEALWEDDLENDGVPSNDAQAIVTRYRKLIAWLTNAVSAITDSDLATPQEVEDEDESDRHSGVVWKLLLGGRVLEACKAARSAGDLNMAALIAQASGPAASRALLARQLAQWRACGAEALLGAARARALRLLAAAAPPRDLAAAGWLRALNAVARYLTPQVPTVERIVAKYVSFFRHRTSDEESEVIDLSVMKEEETGMEYPAPPYHSNYDVYVEIENKKKRILDLRYELLHAKATNSRPKLSPASYTPDPLDYSLSFLLGTWFDSPSVQSIVGFAEQLEALGEWHLAVQILMYHPDDKIRAALVRGALGRGAPARARGAAGARAAHAQALRVPRAWLLLAQAHRAKYMKLPAVEAEHLAGAGHWNAAHKVLMEELLPQAVLADELTAIGPLLESMHEAAQRHEVADWERGGLALYQYYHVCREMAAGGVSGGGAEALRARVAAAVRALGGAAPGAGPRARAARAEMGARLLQLALAAGEPPGHLAALLKTLKLPPDYRATAEQRITSMLAEQASESCAESTATSPLSSHQRTVGGDLN